MLLAHDQLPLEQLGTFAFEIVAGCRTWKMAAISIWIVQEELHCSFAMVQDTRFITEQEVHLAERAVLSVSDLDPSPDEFDLSDMNKPIEEQVFEVPPNSVFVPFEEKVLEVIDVNGRPIEGQRSCSEWIVDERRTRQNPLEIVEALAPGRRQLVTASGFGAYISAAVLPSLATVNSS